MGIRGSNLVSALPVWNWHVKARAKLLKQHPLLATSESTSSFITAASSKMCLKFRITFWATKMYSTKLESNALYEVLSSHLEQNLVKMMTGVFIDLYCGRKCGFVWRPNNTLYQNSFYPELCDGKSKSDTFVTKSKRPFSKKKKPRDINHSWMHSAPMIPLVSSPFDAHHAAELSIFAKRFLTKPCPCMRRGAKAAGLTSMSKT